ncbi:MAG: hypothetical protein ACRDMV_18025 [Streptosporangiales bacterium]
MKGWATITDAALLAQRPAWTIRSWIRRGHLPTICHTHTGRLLVWLPDLADLHYRDGYRCRRVA